MTALLLDTGPLFAYLSEDDTNHAWAVRQFAVIQRPMFTCEPVLSEAAYLIQQRGESLNELWSFLRRGMFRASFRLEAEFESVATLMHRYSNVPMDLADACLVRMSELNRDCRVFTTDSDFNFYRRFGRQVIPLVIP